MSYELTPHVCGTCMGRILVTHADGGKIYRCACCGRTGVDIPESICACGVRLKPGKDGKPGKHAGLRCEPNPAVTLEFPSEIVAATITGKR